MGKRYYCDYCDRSFKDDTDARKKHLSSLQHVQNRANHYNQFKDAETILREESAKIPCKRFMAHGECAFGVGCRFSHYTPQMMWELQQIAETKKQKCMFSENERLDMDDMMKKIFDNVEEHEVTEEQICPIWDIPAELRNYSNLPPSLWPITPDNVTNSIFTKWGL